MSLPLPSSDNVLQIYLTLSQYPILDNRIRSRMRKEMFDRGIIAQEDFEAEVRQKAIESQGREGLQNPYGEESSEIWEKRLSRIRASLTDFYFAYNLPYADFERIIREMLTARYRVESDFVWFNPELAPQDMLFEQAEMIAHMPEEERARYRPRLQEIKVVLIRTMISDQLKYIKIARQWFKVADLVEIRNRKIGGGKIGGKAAGMLLAVRILKETASPELRDSIRIPESYFLGSDVFYNFMSLNGLMYWNDQKYKSEEQIRADYPMVQAEFSRGQLPPEILERLKELVWNAGKTPLIVRSSSLLEDNFGVSFPGKYESIFCPNQGTLEENLFALTSAIVRVYASSFNPDALIYLHQNGLADYDNRIAVLIQHVEGEQFGRYYLPQGAGVAFSRNLYRWSPQIRQEDGFLRLVWGLGTRAVDQAANDYPRLVALSHPVLFPNSKVEDIHQYSQHYIDLIDLDGNKFKTLPISDLITPRYPGLRYICEIDQGGYLTGLRTNLFDPANLVVTYNGLFQGTPFVANMRDILSLLETHYKVPVEVEFVFEFENTDVLNPTVRLSIVQCRPQSHISREGDSLNLPLNLQNKDILFSTRRMVTNGVVKNIRYILYVTPDGYFNLKSQNTRNELQRMISKLNSELAEENFILIGPGRWGTTTPDLGVHVKYSDIYNTRALIELTGSGIGTAPEPSFGTHFFQDLMEAKIYPLAIYLDDIDTVFKREFFETAKNRLKDWLDCKDKDLINCLRLIDVHDSRSDSHIDLILDSEKGKATAFWVVD